MSEGQDKLSWSAFRYVANELDAAEASEFESLLMTDQAAREAVASAVEETIRIRSALAGAVVVTAASQRPNWSRRQTRLAVVLCGSCLTLLVALFLVRSSLPISGEVARQAIDSGSASSAAQLAFAWAETRGGLTELQLGDAEFSDPLDTALSGPVDPESEQSLAAPSWMLAALEKMDGGIESGLEIQE